MSRARNIKSPDHRYFDMDVISELSDEGEPFVDLVVSYATYVLTRAKTFSGRSVFIVYNPLSLYWGLTGVGL